MNFSLIAQGILKTIPVLIEVAEKLHKPGAEKKRIVMDEVVNQLSEYSPELAKHPRVIEAVGKVNDAVVEAHNVINEVENSLNK